MKTSRRWRRLCRRQLSKLTGPWRRVRHQVKPVLDVIDTKCR